MTDTLTPEEVNLLEKIFLFSEGYVICNERGCGMGCEELKRSADGFAKKGLVSIELIDRGWKVRPTYKLNRMKDKLYIC